MFVSFTNCLSMIWNGFDFTTLIIGIAALLWCSLVVQFHHSRRLVASSSGDTQCSSNRLPVQWLLLSRPSHAIIAVFYFFSYHLFVLFPSCFFLLTPDKKLSNTLFLILIAPSPLLMSHAPQEVGQQLVRASPSARSDTRKRSWLEDLKNNLKNNTRVWLQLKGLK